MKYLLMITEEPVSVTPTVARADALRETGELIGYAELAHPSTGSTVAVRDGAAAVIDDPCAVSGLYLVDCESDDRARELAELVAGTGPAAVVIRPVMVESGLEM